MKEQESPFPDPSNQLWIDKLKGLHFEPEPRDWEILHAKLQQHQEDDILRKQISLQHHTYSDAAFENLESRIRSFHQNVRYIRLAKMAELFACWLLIWFFFKGGMDLNKPSNDQSTFYKSDTVVLNSHNNEGFQEYAPSALSNLGLDKVQKHKNPPLYPKRNALANNVVKSNNIPPELHTTFYSSTKDINQYRASSDKIELISSTENQEIATAMMVQSEITRLPITITSMAINTNLLAPMQKTTSTLAPIHPKTNSWWVDLGGIISRDLIKSPYPVQISEERLGRISGSGGLNTGVVYSTPITDLAVSAQYEFKSYESVYGGRNQIHMISIPLQIRFKLPEMGAFQGYITTGLLPQFAAYAHYSETAYFETNPHLRYRENNIKLNSAGILSTSAYESGILEGESYRGNQSLSAILGIGAEYQVNERIKIYLEQSYQHSLGKSSFGPGFDQFFSSTIHIGVRTPFKIR